MRQTLASENPGDLTSQIWRHILSISMKLNFLESLIRSLKTLQRRAFGVAAMRLLVSVAGAQNTASISGTVRDISDALVPGAKVTLINQSSKATRDTTSNGEGFFNRSEEHTSELQSPMYLV